MLIVSDAGHSCGKSAPAPAARKCGDVMAFEFVGTRIYPTRDAQRMISDVWNDRTVSGNLTSADHTDALKMQKFRFYIAILDRIIS